MPDNRQLHIAPNKPLFVALVDPEGEYDDGLRQGRYQTTAGEILVLPRPAVVELNLVEPKPGEEIVIQKHWDGRPGSGIHWTVALSTRSELARAAQEEGQDLTPVPQIPIEAVQERKAATASPTPIRRPVKKESAPESQPRLFDRGQGTGTYGPAPATTEPAPAILPAAARSRIQKPGQIPANVATREILSFIQSDPNTANWSDQSRQDLASTILIAAYRAGHIGLWERGE